MIKALGEKYAFPNWNLLSFFVFFLGCIVLIPKAVILPQGTGTDFSYMQALNWIWSQHLPLTFGSDIIYTYGPLGFLCYKVADNWQVFFFILLFQIYLYSNYVLILKAFMPVKPGLGLFVILATIFFFEKEFNESTYYFIFLFSIFSFLQSNKYKYLINAAFIALICFFIKINFGLVQLVLLWAIIVYALIFKKGNSVKLIVTALATVLTLIALSVMLNINIKLYVINSLEMIAGYNEAMVILVSTALKRFQFAVLTLIAYNVITFYYLYKSRFKPNQVLRYFLTLVYILIIFKYSFVRADMTKTSHSFFVFIVVAIGLQYLFEEAGYKNRLRELACFNFLLAGAIYLSFNPFMGKPEIKHALSVSFFNDLTGKVSEKFQVSAQITNRGRLMPQHILRKIGNGSVDLMPYNLSLLLINQLNYSPRPTLQSYAAFTPALDSINCRKYISAGSEFVLFNCSSIDNREPFWDEAATKKALMQYYQVVDSFEINDAYESGYNSGYTDNEKYLLLERCKNPRQPIVSNQVAGELILNVPFYVDTSPVPQYLFADIKYSFAGKVKSILFQPSLINVVFCYETGKTDTFRTVRSILQTGVLINKEVTNTDNAEIFFKTDGAANGKVSWIKFEPSDNFSFQREAKFRTQLITYK